MLKTPKSQKAQQSLSQKNRNQVLNLLHRQQPMHNRRPVRKTERIYHQNNQTHRNKQADRVRTQDQQMTNTYRQSKGSNDAVKLHNRFGVFDDTDDMEFEETPTRPRAPNSRSISPVHPP